MQVSCVISSDLMETEEIKLNDSNKNVFNRGGIDSFILFYDK